VSRRSGGRGRRSFAGAGGSAPAFVPTDISGCVLWLQSNLGVTHTTTVSAWADQSSAGNNYAAGVAQPNYSATGWNGTKPDITYTGAEILDGSTSLLSASALTIAILFKTTQAPGGDVTLFGMRYNAFHYSFDLTSAKKLRCYLNGAISESNAVLNDGAAHVAIATWDKTLTSGSVDFYIDGTLQTTIGTDVSDIVANNDKNAIGGEARQGSADAPQFAGSLPLVIAYSKKLSAGERSNVNSYMSGY